MRYHEFGSEHEETLLFLQPCLVTWDLLLPDIDLLAQSFHVVVPVIPGHDFQEGGDFTSVERVAKDIEDWLIARDLLDLQGIYGSGMGGAIALRLVADGRVRMRHVILHAGLVPHATPKPLRKLRTLLTYLHVEFWKHAGGATARRLMRLRPSRDQLGIFKGTLQRVTNRTVWNVFDSCSSYELPEHLSTDAEVEYWYGASEERVRQHDIDSLCHRMSGVQVVRLPGGSAVDYALQHMNELVQRITSALGSETDMAGAVASSPAGEPASTYDLEASPVQEDRREATGPLPRVVMAPAAKKDPERATGQVAQHARHLQHAAGA